MYCAVRYRVALPILAAALSLLPCFARAQSATDGPTFTRDVLPILQRHCQECHRPGQVGPMSLLTYPEVRPWAKAVRNAVADRVMPPFHANAPLGRFTNDLRLTDAQIETVTAWVDRGAPQGDAADAPAPVEWPRDEWAIGEPDLVLEFPEYSSKPINTDEEILLFSDHVFQHQTWVKTFELKSSDYRMIHHAGVHSVGPKLFVPPDLVLDSADEHLDKFDGQSNGGLALFGERNLYTWLPGQRTETRPEGAAFLIKPGERIVIQTHIPPTDQTIASRLSLGMKFMDEPLTLTNGGFVSFMFDLTVPPGDGNFVSREIKGPFKRDVLVTGFSIHMHLRGKASQILFHYPDGRTETVFDLPGYNFDWQRRYWLAEPLPTPAGTTVEFIGVWDNSAENPLNPDPTAEVDWGPRTTDEMYTGAVYFSAVRDEPVPVSKGREVSRTSGD